jgi:hypothetical protein
MKQEPSKKIEWRLRAYKNNNDYFNSKYYLEKFFKREIEARFFFKYIEQ